MIQISDDLDDLQRLLSPSFLQKAQRATLTAIRNKARTYISQSTRKIYNVKARAIADRVRVVTSNDKTAMITYMGTRIGLVNFDAKFRKVRTKRGSRQGVTVRWRKDKGRGIVSRGFIAEGRNNNVHIFQRLKANQKERYPIRSLKGPSIPQMVKQGEVLDDLTKYLEAEMPDIMKSKMQYYLEQQFS